MLSYIFNCTVIEIKEDMADVEGKICSDSLVHLLDDENNKFNFPLQKSEFKDGDFNKLEIGMEFRLNIYTYSTESGKKPEKEIILYNNDN